MVPEGVLDGVDMVWGLHVGSTEKSGVISVGEGPITAAADSFFATVSGVGGHGAFPHRALDPIWLVSQVLPAVYGIIPRRIDPTLKAVITVGSIHAGTVGNVIPMKVDMTGTIVTPGILDIHVHVYHTRAPEGEPEGLSVLADAHSFRSGVTTMVDTGTAGWRHMRHFKQTVIDRVKTRVFAYVNIVDQGMIGDFEQDPRTFDPELAAAAVEAYRDVCVGIKTAHYWTHKPYDDLHTPWAAVDQAIKAAELCKLPVMYDFWPRPERTYTDLILKKARQPIADCVVEAEAERAGVVPRVFTKIHLKYVVAGRGLDPKQVERAVKLSKEKYCSATQMLGKTAAITYEIAIVDGDRLPPPEAPAAAGT